MAFPPQRTSVNPGTCGHGCHVLVWWVASRQQSRCRKKARPLPYSYEPRLHRGCRSSTIVVIGTGNDELKLTHDTYFINASTVSLSFIFTNPPEYLKEKKNRKYADHAKYWMILGPLPLPLYDTMASLRSREVLRGRRLPSVAAGAPLYGHSTGSPRSAPYSLWRPPLPPSHTRRRIA